MGKKREAGSPKSGAESNSEINIHYSVVRYSTLPQASLSYLLRSPGVSVAKGLSKMMLADNAHPSIDGSWEE